MIRNPFLKFLVWPWAAVYEALVRLRVFLYSHEILRPVAVHRRVVSVGNLTLGGTGKTPFTLRVAELLREHGEAVAVLLRGYKRKSRESIVLVSDGSEHLVNTRQSGDEAQVLARELRGIPVVVGSPKWRGACWMEKHLPAGWIVVDDAFQHLKLRRDVNILLLDAESPFDNGRMVPRGRLREPASAIQRADVIVCVARGRSADPVLIEKWRHLHPSCRWFVARRAFAGISVLEGDQPVSPEEIKGKRLFAFCGLGQPEQFFEDLKTQNLNIVGTMAFPDHHRYRQRDFRRILSRTLELRAEALITTAKDAVNFGPRDFGNWFCYVYKIKMEIRDEERFLKAIRQS